MSTILWIQSYPLRWWDWGGWVPCSGPVVPFEEVRLDPKRACRSSSSFLLFRSLLRSSARSARLTVSPEARQANGGNRRPGRGTS